MKKEGAAVLQAYKGSNVMRWMTSPCLLTKNVIRMIILYLWVGILTMQLSTYRSQNGEKKFLFDSKIAVYRYLEAILDHAHTVYTIEEFTKFEKTLGSSKK